MAEARGIESAHICSLYIPRGDSGIYDSSKKEMEEVAIGWGVIEVPSEKDLLVGYVADKGRVCNRRGDLIAKIAGIKENSFSLYDTNGNLFVIGDFQGNLKYANGEEFYCPILGHVANKAKKVMNAK